MKKLCYYGRESNRVSLGNGKYLDWEPAPLSGAVEVKDGVMIIPNRLAYPERAGKIRNLVKCTREGKVIWTIEPSFPEVPPQQYDYFTRLEPHDESLNQVAAYTGSGFKLIVDVGNGEIKGVFKDHIYRFLEVNRRNRPRFRDLSHVSESSVILDDQRIIDFPGKRVIEAIEVDDGIFVHFDYRVGFPEYQESEAYYQAERQAKRAGTTIAPMRADFPRAIANIIKVRTDGTLIHPFLPGRARGLASVTYWSWMNPGNNTTEIEFTLGTYWVVDVKVYDVYTLQHLRTYKAQG